MPEGKIIFSHTGKYCKWYQSDGKNKTYIPKKKRYLAEQLALKKYLTLQLKGTSYEKKIIDYYLSHHISDAEAMEQLMAESSEYQDLLSPYFTNNSKELNDWQHADYEKSQRYPENLIYKSISGNVLRSKSEVLIDMMLYANHIPFRYEEVIQLGDITIAPDFTIKHPVTGQLYYWEHFGKMDDSNYAGNTGNKLQLYISHGIIPSIQLITTYETKKHPLGPDEVRNIIQEYFLK